MTRIKALFNRRRKPHDRPQKKRQTPPLLGLTRSANRWTGVLIQDGIPTISQEQDLNVLLSGLNPPKNTLTTLNYPPDERPLVLRTQRIAANLEASKLRTALSSIIPRSRNNQDEIALSYLPVIESPDGAEYMVAAAHVKALSSDVAALNQRRLRLQHIVPRPIALAYGLPLETRPLLIIDLEERGSTATAVVGDGPLAIRLLEPFQDALLRDLSEYLQEQGIPDSGYLPYLISRREILPLLEDAYRVLADDALRLVEYAERQDQQVHGSWTIVVVGTGSALPGLLESLRHFAVGHTVHDGYIFPGINSMEPQEQRMLAPAYCAALLSDRANVPLDLYDPQHFPRPLSPLVPAIPVATTLATAGLLALNTMALNQQLTMLHSQIRNLQPQVQEAQQSIQRQQQLERQIQQAEVALRPWALAVDLQTPWHAYMAALLRHIPAEYIGPKGVAFQQVYLERIKGGGTRLRITASAANIDSIIRVMDALRTPGYNARLMGISRAQNGTGYSFEATVEMSKGVLTEEMSLEKAPN